MQRMPQHSERALPPPLRTRSFPRHDSATGKNTSLSPASILTGQNPDPLTQSPQAQTPDLHPERSHSDVFEAQDDEEPSCALNESQDDNPQEGFGKLPVEIQSLMERFLESLSLKSASVALSIDRLAALYQDFYVHVETHISTHIAALSTQIAREKSPTPSTSSLGSAASIKGGRRGPRDQPPTSRQNSEQQLLTVSEVSSRRRARRQLELKRLAMEEAVERGVCERVYPRLWRHSSTDDESRDAKLRSRAAALSVVGVDLKELLSTAMISDGSPAPSAPVAEETRKESVREKLAEAKANLENMNDDRYPLAKLQRLSTVHKNIVESLSQLFPSSSSADEILPTLIFVLIISSPETLNVVSNLSFIQRFRNQNRIDGEAAYCLTNLEAATSFLETVDLSSIRRDELPEGPQKNGSADDGQSMSRMDSPNPLYRGLPLSPPQPTSPSTRAPSHSRRLSSLLSSKPSRPLEAASGAVDNAYDAMHHALDGSFKFLFGRLKEKQSTHSPVDGVTVPKTLEEAHRLVSRDEKDGIEDGADVSHVADLAPTTETFIPASGEDAASRMLKLVGGRRARDQSTTSSQSADSENKAASVDQVQDTPSLKHANTALHSSSGNGSVSTMQPHNPSYNNAVEQMRNLGNTLNPLNYKAFSMRGLSRNVTPTGPLPSAADSISPAPSDTTTAAVARKEPEQAPAVDLMGIGPPIQRFVELTEAKELNGFDVDLLLRDYRRLAGVLKTLQQ